MKSHITHERNNMTLEPAKYQGEAVLLVKETCPTCEQTIPQPVPLEGAPRFPMSYSVVMTGGGGHIDFLSEAVWEVKDDSLLDMRLHAGLLNERGELVWWDSIGWIHKKNDKYTMGNPPKTEKKKWFKRD
jgi:hypothetical protein